MDGKTKNPSLLRFGIALKHFRVEAGFSQEELAEKAGIDRSYLGAIERGEHNVALLNVLRICCALNITPARLFEHFTAQNN